MKKILLTACGLSTDEIKNAFFRLVPKNSKNSNIAIISTSQPKLKEKHPKMILVRDTFNNMGFKNVEFIDIEFEDVNKMKKFDIIFLNGGYPFYLLYHFKKTGADKILNELIDSGKVVIGASAGSVALGPNNNLCNFLYPEDNIFGVTDLSALNVVDTIIYPHYREQCEMNSNLEDEISKFEAKCNCKVTRLNNNEAILVLDDKIEKIG